VLRAFWLNPYPWKLAQAGSCAGLGELSIVVAKSPSHKQTRMTALAQGSWSITAFRLRSFHLGVVGSGVPTRWPSAASRSAEHRFI